MLSTLCHLAYVSIQCVISAFQHCMSLQSSLFGWAMSVSSFLLSDLLPACDVTDCCELQACMQQQIGVVLSLTNIAGLSAGYFNMFLSL